MLFHPMLQFFFFRLLANMAGKLLLEQTMSCMSALSVVMGLSFGEVIYLLYTFLANYYRCFFFFYMGVVISSIIQVKHLHFYQLSFYFTVFC